MNQEVKEIPNHRRKLTALEYARLTFLRANFYYRFL